MKKASKRSERRPSAVRKRKAQTGVEKEWGFFLGGNDAVAGNMHCKMARWAEEYRDLEVYQIVTRIEHDIEELFAHAHQLKPYEQFMRKTIIKGIADGAGEDLLRRLTSHYAPVRDDAWKEYGEHIKGMLEDEPKHAAGGLAFVGKQVALLLENLYVKRQKLMIQVAAECDLWPVNLGLETRQGVQQWALTRKNFADRYIKGLKLNRACRSPTGHAGGAAPMSPITLAAESLYCKLLLLQPTNPGAFVKNTQWARRLRALPSPMTNKNANKWWKIAKIYLEERWETAREEFARLERYLRLELSSKYPYESRIKSRVIDDALKKAFHALAKAEL
ncbi:MAG: hypothetical protein ABJB09_07365 [Verrucomicrobiota bacterium]